jgi:hypothetical protein
MTFELPRFQVCSCSALPRLDDPCLRLPRLLHGSPALTIQLKRKKVKRQYLFAFKSLAVLALA